MTIQKNRKVENMREKIGVRVLGDHTPSPESDSIPLLDLKSLRLLGRRTSAAGGLAGGDHRNVRIQSSHPWKENNTISSVEVFAFFFFDTAL